MQRTTGNRRLTVVQAGDEQSAGDDAMSNGRAVWGARRHLSVICALERLGTELTENGTLVKFCEDLWSWTPAVSPNLNPNQILCHRLDRDQSLHKIERIRQFPVPTMQHGVNTTFYSAPFCKRWICYGIFLSLSVCPSVTLRYCVKAREHRGMRSSLSGSPVSLVFWCRERLMRATLSG